MKVSADLKYLASRTASARLRVHTVGDGKAIAEWKAGEAGKNDLMQQGFRSARAVFLPNSRQLLVASGINLAIHDLLTGKIEQVLEPATGEISGIAIAASATGQRLAIAGMRMGPRPGVFAPIRAGMIIPDINLLLYACDSDSSFHGAASAW